MLSIAQSDHGYHCFEWVPTEKGPRVVNFSNIKDKNCCINNDFEIPISSFKIKNNKNSNSLSVVLNSKNVNITSFTINHIDNASQSIIWYENNILNKDYLKNYDVFYYPMKAYKKHQELLVIAVKRNLKEKIISLASEYSYKLMYLSVDIFSAYTLVRQMHNIPQNQNLLLWKIDKNNFHCLTYYEEGFLSSFMIVKCNKKSFNIIKKIGCLKSIDIIEKFILKTIIGKKNCIELSNVFVYQNKKNESLIKSFVNDKKMKIKLLDLSRIFQNKTKNPYNFLSYVENGISFRGIDV